MTSPRQSDRAFGLTFAGVFCVVFAVGWFGFDARLDWALVLAGLFALAAMAAPWLLLPLNRLWGRLGRGLGHVNNHALLGLFFYLMVLPMGLIIRAAGRDTMGRKFPGSAGSYWKPVERHQDGETLKDMF